MKKVYRNKYLKIRKTLTNKEILDQIIFNKTINNNRIKNSNLLLIYISTEDEVNTISIINYFLPTKKIAVPKIENKVMNFYYINSISELKKGTYNILEPTTNNQVKDFNNCVSITPGICFSKDLYRLGYGGGYYDKFYAYHLEIYKIGLCYHELLLDNIPHDDHDVKMDEIITSNKKV